MKTVRTTTWKTTDDRLHTDKKVAEKHQAFLDLSQWFATERSNEAYFVASQAVLDRDTLIALLKKAAEAP